MNTLCKIVFFGIVSILTLSSVYAREDDAPGSGKDIVELYSAPVMVQGQGDGGLGCQHLNKGTNTLEVTIEVLDDDGGFVAGGLDILTPSDSGANIFYFPWILMDSFYVCKWTYSGNDSDLRAIAVVYRLEDDGDNIKHVPLITVEGTE